MTSYTEASRLYRSLGWGVVAPAKLHPESKTPAEGIFKVFGRGNTATPNQMDGWEEAFPERNCLLKMPVGVIGIDIDHYWKKDKHGSWTFKQGYSQLLEDIVRYGDLPQTYSSTSRGPLQYSRILFYKVDPGIEFENQPYPDVELIQNHHRYACVWPSVHPDTGETYKWYDPTGAECAVPSPELLASLPREWYEPLLTTKAGKKSSRNKAYSGGSKASHAAYEGSAEDWVNALNTSPMSLSMHMFWLNISEKKSPHIGHDELLSLLGKLNFLQSTCNELGGRTVFDLILDNYLTFTNEPNPLVEISNAIKYVAGKDFKPCLN